MDGRPRFRRASDQSALILTRGLDRGCRNHFLGRELTALPIPSNFLHFQPEDIRPAGPISSGYVFRGILAKGRLTPFL